MKNRNTKGYSHRKQPKKTNPAIWMVLGGLLLIAVAGLVVLANRPAPKAAFEVNGSASLKVDKEQVDLGDVQLGNTVSAAFTLTNVGDRPLKLTKAPYIQVVEGC